MSEFEDNAATSFYWRICADNGPTIAQVGINNFYSSLSISRARYFLNSYPYIKHVYKMLSILVITYMPVCMRYFCVMQALRRQFEWDLNLATVQWFQLKKLLFLCNVVCKSCVCVCI